VKKTLLGLLTLGATLMVQEVLAQPNVTFTKKVIAGGDDVEEEVATGSMYITSSDLELTTDGSTNQLIGIRFTSLPIPKGATIQHAFIQFTTKGDKAPVSGALTIKAVDADDAGAFTSTASDVSSRATTTTSVSWSGSTSSTWGTTGGGTRGADQRTPDLKTVVQAIVSRSGWASGNAMSFVITGSGVRNSYAYEGNKDYAPELIVQYTTAAPGPLAVTSFPIEKNSQWYYLDDGTSQDATAWKSATFIDSVWSRGPGKLGYSDNAVTTLNYGPSSSAKYITYYFRKRFNVTSVAALADSLQINLLRDDAAVIYINGTEVARSNMPSGSFDYMTFSSTIVDGADETTYFPYHIPKSFLVNGENVITVEVHQRDGTSSDLGFDLEMKEMPQPSLIRGPYLQVGTPVSMNIRWRTDLPTQSRVHYGLSADTLSYTVTDSASVTEHELKLTGLTPNTRYYYSIGSLTDTMQGDTSNYFSTLTPAGNRTILQRIGVIGDCGNNSTNQKNVRDRVLNYLGSNYMNAWILLGDNAYTNGTETEFQSSFFNIYKDNFLKQNPLFPAPGNHDYNNGSSVSQADHNVPYYSIFSMPVNAEAGGLASHNKAYYSFDIGNVHFLSLDSYGEEDTGSTRMYDTLGAQVTWIKADLAANKNKDWVVAYWHHPPYTKGSHNSDTEDELVHIRENFIQILERMGVDLILCGHSHDYERSRLMGGHYGMESTFDSATHNLSGSSALYDGSDNSCPYIKDSASNFRGTVYVVSGSAGQLGGTTAGYPHNAMYYSDATNGGAMMLEVQNNRLDAKWICADGMIRDQFTMMKNINMKNEYTIKEGDTIALSASFKGRYTWNTSADTAKTIRVSPPDTTLYVVKDNYGCVADSFTVNVIPKPITGIGTPGLAAFDVLVAPNPAKDNEMMISLKGSKPLNARLQLTDISGRVLMNRQLPLNATPQYFLPALQKGVYILSVTDEHNIVYKKLVIE